MNMFKRGMLFLSLFGSCVAVALLVASLGTKKWVVSGAKRSSNPVESDGRIYFGLFDGRKELNVAYGWRGYDIDVVQLLRYEPEFLIYGLWLGSVGCVGAALLLSLLAGVAAAGLAASKAPTSRCLAGVRRLYLWNILSLLSSIAAISCWTAQYHYRIQHNVLSRDDRDNMWSSEGRAHLGYSFWFVVGAAIACFVNVLIVFIGNTGDRSSGNPVIPMVEEKTNGAIMLY